MTKYYLAVDIGASSGRHMLGHMENGRMVTEEIYRFENGMEKKNGHLCWNVARLFSEIKSGLKKCRELGKIPVSMGIDTWAVDYVLLDEGDRLVGETYGYRDDRTAGMDQAVYEVIPEAELYEKTGIQKQIFNTIYQLMAVKQEHPDWLQQAKTFLMLPDYFHFLLTGKKGQEYTNATSTQLVNAKSCDWDWELIRRLGYKEDLFLPICMPGTVVGDFTEELQQEIGFDCQVVLPATHDTGSAVMAVPVTGESTSGHEDIKPEDAKSEDIQSEDTQSTSHPLYISSGTWSLMGVENAAAICTEESRQRNFTNEGGYDHRFRFLKNIMGLWMIQSVRHEWKDMDSFAELCELAEDEKGFPSRVDVNDPSFLAPESMVEAVKESCRKSGQKVPQTKGEIAAVIYRSLAESYRQTVQELEAMTGEVYPSIHILGGGSNASYLNQLTADACRKEVYAGPGEATAIGNLMAQMIQGGVFADIQEARACVAGSFEIRKFAPQSLDALKDRQNVQA